MCGQIWFIYRKKGGIGIQEKGCSGSCMDLLVLNNRYNSVTIISSTYKAIDIPV